MKKRDGILPDHQIRRMLDRKTITGTRNIENDQIQPASLDLRLDIIAYRLQASFLPGRDHSVKDKLEDLAMARLDLREPAVLERGCVYLVPLMESLSLPANLRGIANPKSTTGRLDIFTRVIIDHGAEFDRINTGYTGPLFAEIAPRSFSIIVEAGCRLGQLRLLQQEAGNPSPAEAPAPNTAGATRNMKLSVNLDNNGTHDVIGYRARKNPPLIDIRKIGHYPAQKFWDEITRPEDGRLILNPGDFYILGSREHVSVAPEYAAEMVPFDAAVGEFRIHYAGFFDPGFGYAKAEAGTQAVLEVRAHDVPFVIEHGQTMGRLVYSRLTETPNRIYGDEIGSSYQHQGVALSKQFRARTAATVEKQPGRETKTR